MFVLKPQIGCTHARRQLRRAQLVNCFKCLASYRDNIIDFLTVIRINCPKLLHSVAPQCCRVGRSDSHKTAVKFNVWLALAIVETTKDY